MTALSGVNWSLPRIAVEGVFAPISCGYWEHGGHLFAADVGYKCAKFCVDLHDLYSENSAHYPRERRVFATTEPPMYAGDFRDCGRIADYYGHVWTWHPELLSKIPHAKKHRLAEKWVTPVGQEDKRFCVTAMFSAKDGEPGSNYRLRHELLGAAQHYEVPTKFWNHSGSWLGEMISGFSLIRARRVADSLGHPAANRAYYPSKQPCFDSMFHVVVENTCLSHYVTEKLIDCFATNTVPILCGDPDIGNEFNMDGIIVLNRNNFVNQINSLSPDDYYKRRYAIAENYERSKPYWNFYTSILHAAKREGIA